MVASVGVGGGDGGDEGGCDYACGEVSLNYLGIGKGLGGGIMYRLRSFGFSCVGCSGRLRRREFGLGGDRRLRRTEYVSMIVWLESSRWLTESHPISVTSVVKSELTIVGQMIEFA